jgi:hypothetical protein
MTAIATPTATIVTAARPDASQVRRRRTGATERLTRSSITGARVPASIKVARSSRSRSVMLIAGSCFLRTIGPDARFGTQAIRQACHTDGRVVDIAVMG